MLVQSYLPGLNIQGRPFMKSEGGHYTTRLGPYPIDQHPRGADSAPAQRATRALQRQVGGTTVWYPRAASGESPGYPWNTLTSSERRREERNDQLYEYTQMKKALACLSGACNPRLLHPAC